MHDYFFNGFEDRTLQAQFKTICSFIQNKHGRKLRERREHWHAPLFILIMQMMYIRRARGGTGNHTTGWNIFFVMESSFSVLTNTAASR